MFGARSCAYATVTCHLTATMSYDLFLYKSDIGKPDIDEATKVIEGDDDIWVKKPYNYEAKTAIEKALIEVDPSLKGFDYQQLAHKKGKTIDEVKQTFMKFELISDDGSNIQLDIYDYHVAITVPFIHRGDEANGVFQKLQNYVDTISNIAGYFLYDPQTGEVFDPSSRRLGGLTKYLSVSKDFEEITRSVESKENKKPWWKLW
jgi:hypothetical protein